MAVSCLQESEITVIDLTMVDSKTGFGGGLKKKCSSPLSLTRSLLIIIIIFFIDAFTAV
jgi:hypothetical protein